MKKILISLAIIAVVAVVAFGATRAYFSDTETSSGNTFTAGTLDLNLNSDAAFTVTASNLFAETTMAPGVSVGPKTLYFRNNGTIAGKVKLNTSYVNADGTPNAVDVSDDDYAKNLLVVSGVTDTIAVQGYWAQHIITTNYSGNAGNAVTDGAVYDMGSGVYVPTVYGLKGITLYFDDGVTPFIWNAGITHDVALTLQLSPAADNNYQSDGVAVTLTATMAQWEDASF